MLNIHLPYKDIAKIGVIFPKTGKAMNLNTACQISDADIIINGGTFDMEHPEKLDSGLKVDGNYRQRREQHGIGINSTGKAEWSYAGTWVPTWFGMYRTGWLNREVKGTPITDVRGRTAIGYNESGITLLCLRDGTSEASKTSPMFTKYFTNCTAAINLDGGGSVQYHTPIEHHSTGRPLPYFIGVWLTPEGRKRLFEGEAYKVDVKTSLRIRKTPSALGAIVGSYKGGDVVHVTAKQNGWAHTERGWVSMQYLAPATDSVPAVNGETYEVFNVVTYLAVRDRAKSSGYKELGKLKRGDRVQVVGFDGNYAKIILDGGYGYVTKSYVRKQQ